MREKSNEPESSASDSRAEERLDSWKQIASYLDRDVRTVARWEKAEGLPVHRHLHLKKPTVYAFKHEIDAWWEGRRQNLENERKPRAPALGHRWALLGSVVAALILASFYLLPARTGERVGQPDDGSRRFVVRSVFPEGSRPGIEGCEARDVARNGAWIACSGASGIGIIDITSKRLHLLTDDWAHDEGPTGGPVFSPDAEQIAYAWTRLGSNVFVLSIVEVFGESRTLYRGDGVEPEPLGWSPDGRWIATNLLREGELWEQVLISAADGTVRFVHEGMGARPRHVTFSPDGRYLAYESPPVRDGFGDIHVVELDSGATGQLTTHRRDDRYPFWTADGRGIFFLSDRTGSVDAWLLPMDGMTPTGTPRPLRRNLGSVSPIALTDAGSLYYFGPTSLSDIYTAEIDFESGQVLRPRQPYPTQFSGVTAHLAWSPDGNRVAYVSGRGWRTRFAIVERELGTGAERELDGMAFARRPQWSPDGGTLLVRGTDLEERRGTFELDPDTGAVVRQRIQGLHETAYWLPGTDALIFSDLDLRLGSGGIYRLGRDDAAPTPVFVAETTSSPSRLLAVSPNGDAIAFTLHHRPTRTTRLAIIDADGGAVRELVRVPDTNELNVQAFTPDGRFILYVLASDENGRELWRVDVETGESVPIELAIDDAHLFSIHPNGRTIGFTVYGGGDSHLYVMERAVPTP